MYSTQDMLQLITVEQRLTCNTFTQIIINFSEMSSDRMVPEWMAISALTTSDWTMPEWMAIPEPASPTTFRYGLAFHGWQSSESRTEKVNWIRRGNVVLQKHRFCQHLSADDMRELSCGHSTFVIASTLSKIFRELLCGVADCLTLYQVSVFLFLLLSI